MPSIALSRYARHASFDAALRASMRHAQDARLMPAARHVATLELPACAPDVDSR